MLAGLGGAAGFLAAFVAIEARSRTPMMPLALFREPRFAGAQLVSVAISAGLFAAFIYLMLYLQQVLGMSAVEAGITLVPGRRRQPSSRPAPRPGSPDVCRPAR